MVVLGDVRLDWIVLVNNKKYFIVVLIFICKKEVVVFCLCEIVVIWLIGLNMISVLVVKDGEVINE